MNGVVEFIAPTAMANYFCEQMNTHTQQVMEFHCRKTISVSTSMKYSSQNESFINERNDYSIIRQTIYEMCVNVQTYLVASSSSWIHWDKKRHLCISCKINVIRLPLWWTFIRLEREGGKARVDEWEARHKAQWRFPVPHSLVGPRDWDAFFWFHLIFLRRISLQFFLLCSPCCWCKFCDMLSVGGARRNAKSTIIIITHIVL